MERPLCAGERSARRLAVAVGQRRGLGPVRTTALEKSLVKEFAAQRQNVALDVSLAGAKALGQHPAEVTDGRSAVEVLPDKGANGVEPVKAVALPHQPLPVQFAALDAGCGSGDELERCF